MLHALHQPSTGAARSQRRVAWAARGVGSRSSGASCRQLSGPRGRFRLVLVLDDVPEELVRLVGYLQSITDRLVIDLVTVAAYSIGGSQVVVPQRVEAERQTGDDELVVPPPDPDKRLIPGADAFGVTIGQARPDHQADLRRLHAWAVSLEEAGYVKLSTYRGKGCWTLLPRLLADNVGLVTIWNDNGPYLSFWRSVFERRAPEGLRRLEETLGLKIGQGNSVKEFPDDLLQALTSAYQEAATGKLKA